MLAFAKNNQYLEAALPQKYIAQRLADYFFQTMAVLDSYALNSSNLFNKLENILELGAGTGFLTKAILNLEMQAKTVPTDLYLNLKKYHINEPNLAMHQQFLKSFNGYDSKNVAQNAVGSHLNTLADHINTLNHFKYKIDFNYLQMNAEDIIKNFDTQKIDFLQDTAITSSMALQWFEKPLLQLQKIFELQPSCIALSFPIAGSFQSWYDYQVQLNIPHPRANFLELSDIKNTCKYLTSNYHIELYTEEVPITSDEKFYEELKMNPNLISPHITPFNMLKHLKKIGAFEMPHIQTAKTPQQQNKFIQGAYTRDDLKKLQKIEKKQAISYHIAYILAIRT